MHGTDWIALLFGALAVVILGAIAFAYVSTPDFLVPVLTN